MEHYILILWGITSLIAYVMLYITESRTMKGFTGYDATIGFVLCALPFVFFLIFSLGLTLTIIHNCKKKATVKFPTITEKDVKEYKRIKRQEKEPV